MTAQKADILMFGQPGRNLQLWFEYFERHPEHYHVTLVCRETGDAPADRNAAPNIEVVAVRGKRGWLRLLPLLRRPRDLVLVQGLYGYRLESFVFLAGRARRKAIQVWNTRNYRRVRESDSALERLCLARMFHRADSVLFSWHANRDAFAELCPEWAGKTAVFPWGIPSRYGDLDHAPASEESSRLLQGVAADSIVLFWPRELAPMNRHDLLLDALPFVRACLPSSIWERLRFIVVGGHPARREHLAELRTRVNALACPDRLVWCEEYIDSDALLPVWNRADILLNLADDDQLSTAVNMSGLRRLVPVLSDIPTYRHLSRAGFDVCLVENSVESVVRTLCDVVRRVAAGESVCDLDRNRRLMLELSDPDRTYAELLAHCLGSREHAFRGREP